MSQLINGFRYVLDGFDLVTRPGLRKYIILPILMNAILFVGLYFVFKHYVQSVDDWLLTILPGWLSWLSYLLWLLFVATFLLVFLVLFATCANIIGAPFYGFLAEGVLRELGAKIEQPQGFFAIAKMIPHALWRQFSLLGYLGVRAILILILMFVPVMHSIVPVLWIILSVWYLCLSMLDYPSDLMMVSLKRVRAFMRQDYALTFGFGLTILGLLTVPVLNLFVPAAAVAGACKWWVERSQK